MSYSLCLPIGPGLGVVRRPLALFWVRSGASCLPSIWCACGEATHDSGGATQPRTVAFLNELKRSSIAPRKPSVRLANAHRWATLGLFRARPALSASEPMLRRPMLGGRRSGPCGAWGRASSRQPGAPAPCRPLTLHTNGPRPDRQHRKTQPGRPRSMIPDRPKRALIWLPSMSTARSRPPAGCADAWSASTSFVRWGAPR